MEVQRGYHDCKSVRPFIRTTRNCSHDATSVRIRDHHTPDSRGVGKGCRPMAQALAYSSAREFGKQETVSRHQYILARTRGIRFAVLAHVPAGTGTGRERATRRTRYQDRVLEV